MKEIKRSKGNKGNKGAKGLINMYGNNGNDQNDQTLEHNDSNTQVSKQIKELVANSNLLTTRDVSVLQLEDVKPKRQKPRPSSKVFRAIRLWVMGMSITDAAKACNITPPTLRAALRSPIGQQEVELARKELDEEFVNLQHKVTEVLRNGLEHPDPQVALSSASLWLRATKERKVEVQVSVEDLMRKMIESPNEVTVENAN